MLSLAGDDRGRRQLSGPSPQAIATTYAYYILPLAGLFAALWVYIDAQERTDYGCLWAAFTFVAWPVVLPLYVVLRICAARGAPAHVREQQEREKEEARRFRFGSEIEKARFLAEIDKPGGTIYQPPPEPGARAAAHFTVERAERLISERRFDEAWEYLIELYSVALAEHNPWAQDTYRNYIARLPGGPARLGEWERESGLSPGPHPPRSTRPPF